MLQSFFHMIRSVDDFQQEKIDVSRKCQCLFFKFRFSRINMAQKSANKLRQSARVILTCKRVALITSSSLLRFSCVWWPFIHMSFKSGLRFNWDILYNLVYSGTMIFFQKNLRSLELQDCQTCSINGFCGSKDDGTGYSINNLQSKCR